MPFAARVRAFARDGRADAIARAGAGAGGRAHADVVVDARADVVVALVVAALVLVLAVEQPMGNHAVPDAGTAADLPHSHHRRPMRAEASW